MWIVAVFLLGFVWRETGATQCSESPLYPVDTCSGDLAVLYGDDEGVEITLSHPVKFYDNVYNTVKVYTNPLLKFGSYPGEPWSGTWYNYIPTGPITTPYIAPALFDAVTYEPGALIYGQSFDAVSGMLAINDAASIGVTLNNPDVVAVFTWYNVRRWNYDTSWTTTLQMVLIADPTHTILVLNYATDFHGWDDVAVQVNRGDGVEWMEVPGSRSAAVNQFFEQSNGNVAGRIVIDVTGPTVSAPVLVSTPRTTPFGCLPVEECPLPPTQCTVDATTGAVNTFDGLQADEYYNNIYHLDRAYIIAKQWYPTSVSHLDQCKFLLIGITDDTGKIHKVNFFIGVGETEELGYVRDYLFGNNVVKASGKVPKVMSLPEKAKGLGLRKNKKSHNSNKVLDMPFTEIFDDEYNMLSIYITGVTIDGLDGWLLTSDVCPYELTFIPGHPSRALVLQLGPEYQSKPLKGLCQDNYDNWPWNDAYDCGRATSGVPDWYSDVDDIAEDCSCGIGDHDCRDWQITETYVEEEL